jgi:hypothetical protein
MSRSPLLTGAWLAALCVVLLSSPSAVVASCAGPVSPPAAATSASAPARHPAATPTPVVARAVPVVSPEDVDGRRRHPHMTHANAWADLGPTRDTIAVLQGQAIELVYPHEPELVAIEAHWNGRGIPFVRQGERWFTVLGVDLDARPGEHRVTLTFRSDDGRVRLAEQIIAVGRQDFPTTTLRVAPRSRSRRGTWWSAGRSSASPAPPAG